MSSVSPSQFLSSLTVDSILKERKGDMVCCDIQDPLSSAFKTLVDNKILAMPVYDTYRKEFKGLIGLLEIVNFIANLHWELLLESVPYREADMYVRFNDTLVEDLVVPGHVKIHDTSNCSVVAQTVLHSDYRRIPVVDDTGKVVHVITYSQIVNQLYKGLEVLDKTFLKRTVSSMAHFKDLYEKMSSGDSKVDLYDQTGIICVNVVAKAIEAFRLIIGTHVSAVPVVDEQQKLVGNISVRDIRAIANNASEIQVLYSENCGEFCKRSAAPLESLYVSPNDTLQTVMNKLYENKIHRVWVKDTQERVIGVVTLKHILAEMAAAH